MSYESVKAQSDEWHKRMEEEGIATRNREDDQAIFWWVLDTEPGQTAKVGYIREGSALWKNLEKLEIYPFKTRDGRYLIFDAGYKIASGGEPLDQEALSKPPPDMSSYPSGFPAPPAAVPQTVTGPIYLMMNFVAGFQIEACEMLMVIGEFASLPGEDGVAKVEAQDGGGAKTAPKPAEWFEWPDEEKVLLNKLYKRTKEASGYNMEVFIFAGRATKLQRHWWLQMYLTGEGGVCEGDRTWPIPGEFLGLGVRMLRGLPWGEQRSSPFVYCGNWVDLAYITSGVITEVIDPTDTIAYPRYKVLWHNVEEPITFNPSDFAEYRVGDRVSILKDVSIDKKLQTSDDDDAKPDCDKSEWCLVPLTYYGDQGKQEE